MNLIEEIRAEAHNESGRGELNGVHKTLMLVAAHEIERLSELVLDLKAIILQWTSDIPEMFDSLDCGLNYALPDEDKRDCGLHDAEKAYGELFKGAEDVLSRCTDYNISISLRRA